VTLNCRVKPTLRSQGSIVDGPYDHSGQNRRNLKTQLSQQFPGGLPRELQNDSVWRQDWV